MDPAIALRAIIRLLAGDIAGYLELIKDHVKLVDAVYYINKNEYVEAKLDTMTGELYIENSVMKWAKCC